MNRILVKVLLTAFIAAAPIILLSQTPPHPNGGNVPGSGNTPVGGASPVGSGMVILLSLAAGYGSRKLYTSYKLKQK